MGTDLRNVIEMETMISNVIKMGIVIVIFHGIGYDLDIMYSQGHMSSDIYY